MSDATQAKGWFEKVLVNLPPAFLALTVFNMAMMYMVLKAVEGQGEQRLQILNKVIETCLAGK